MRQIPSDIFEKCYRYAQAHNREIYASHFDPEREDQWPDTGDRCFYSYEPPRDGAAWVVDPAGIWWDCFNIGG